MKRFQREMSRLEGMLGGKSLNVSGPLGPHEIEWLGLWVVGNFFHRELAKFGQPLQCSSVSIGVVQSTPGPAVNHGCTGFHHQ